MDIKDAIQIARSEYNDSKRPAWLSVLIHAAEKQIRKPPAPYTFPSPIRKGYCSNCLRVEDSDSNYCRSCGQAIDWTPPPSPKEIEASKGIDSANEESTDNERCRTCEFSAIIGTHVFCDYLLITGKRRNCPAGENCKKYKERSATRKNALYGKPRKY